MTKNFSKTTLSLGEGRGDLQVYVADSGNVRLHMPHVAGETFHAPRSKRSTYTYLPVGQPKGNLLATVELTTPDGRKVTVRTFDSGRVSVNLDGKWLLGRMVYRHTPGFFQHTLIPM